MSAVRIDPIEPFPFVQPHDDLAKLVCESAEVAGIDLRSAQVLVVTAKVASKAENRLVDLAGVDPSLRARAVAELTGKDPRLVELVLAEAIEVIRARPGVLLTRSRQGFISANAGIDGSNADSHPDRVLLLPSDPDRSALRIRQGIHRVVGADLGVIISDSHGRPFRVGNVGTAIGVSGIKPVLELEGNPDLYGRPLTAASRTPVADALAAIAAIVMGEGDQGVPAVAISGLHLPQRGDGRAADLLRDPRHDLFASPSHQGP